jgi:hypothetical protein
MQNMVVLYKLDDGTIYCKQLTEKGLEYMNEDTIEDLGYWEEGGTITLDELEEILDKER